VRQLLARRAKIRRDQLGEPVAAAADLKKLHDLSPTDQAVMDELAGLYMELNDYKSLVQLYEDQILRGKDMNARAELARKVARIWEEQLADAREAADAWRRVLRMRAGDAEATQGLERAKTNQLKKPEGDPKFVYAPPKLVSDQPIPPPGRPSSPKNASQPPSASASPKRTTSGERMSLSASSTTAVPTQVRTPQVNGPKEEPTRTGETTLARPLGGSPAGRASNPPPGPATDSVATALRGFGKTLDTSSIEKEIDASFDRLEMDGRSDETATTRVREPVTRRGSMRPNDLAFSAATDEVTESGEALTQIARAPKADASGATERPSRSTDPAIGGSDSESIRTAAPITIPSALANESSERLESSDILEADADDPTGTDLKVLDLEATHSGASDGIVIADDIAEAIEDHDDETATGTVPPYRSNS